MRINYSNFSIKERANIEVFAKNLQVLVDQELSAKSQMLLSSKGIKLICGEDGPTFEARLVKSSLINRELFISERGEPYLLLLYASDYYQNSTLVRVLRKSIRKFAMEFSEAERRTLIKMNPLLYRIANVFKGKIIHSSNKVIVIRDHLLLEKFNLVKCLISVGFNPSNIFFIPKRDLCLYRSKVRAAMKKLKVNLVDFSGDRIDSRLTRELNDRKSVIIDDGGDFILKCNELAIEAHYIETTSKGISLLRSAGLYDKIVNISDSSIKLELSNDIAYSFVMKLRQLVSHRSLSNSGSVVIGYGNIGSIVANILRSIGSNVVVVEKSKMALAKASADGFNCFSSLNEAVCIHSPTFILGCSGNASIGSSVLEICENEIFFCAVSSQDLAKLIVHLKAYSDIKKIDGWGYVANTERGLVHVLGYGDALNLFHSEGVSEPEYDTFTCLMFLAILQGAMDCNSCDLTKYNVEQLCNYIRYFETAIYG